MLSAETAEKLRQWQDVKEILKESKKLEMSLRKELFAEFFPDPIEGTNKLELMEGWGVKGIYKLERKVDEAALPAVFEELAKLKIPSDKLVKWKPELAKAEWNKLTDVAKEVFAEALVTKPGSPSLEVTAPKTGSI